MSLDIRNYTRIPFPVRAVRVTNTNMAEVAEWVDGKVETAISKFIYVNIPNAKHIRQTQAMVGDWLVESEGVFKIYTNKSFESSFELVKEDASAEADAIIVQIVEAFRKGEINEKEFLARILKGTAPADTVRVTPKTVARSRNT
jgi:hypothetical protein